MRTEGRRSRHHAVDWIKTAKLPANVRTIRRAVSAVAESGYTREFRIDGVRGLVLLALPSGTATWHLHYDVAIGRMRRRRKLKIGRLDDASLADAMVVAERQRPAIRTGADPVAKRQHEQHEPTFAELVEERFAKGSPLRPATERDYRHVLAHDVLPALGAFPVGRVTRDQVMTVINKVAAPGALATLQSARTAAAIGDGIAAEEALVDAYNHLSKLLRDVEVHERGRPCSSIALWRSHPPT